MKRDYFSSVAPIVVKNHVIVGVGGDFLDVPNFAEARDPETGDVQWHFWTTAHEGDPGFKSWPTVRRGAWRRRHSGTRPPTIRS